MRFPTMWQFDKLRLQPPFKLRNSKLCSVSSLIQATSKSSFLVAHTTFNVLEISCRGSILLCEKLTVLLIDRFMLDLGVNMQLVKMFRLK